MNFHFDPLNDPHLETLNRHVCYKSSGYSFDPRGYLWALESTLYIVARTKDLIFPDLQEKYHNSIQPREWASYATFPHAGLLMSFSKQQLAEVKQFVSSWAIIEGLKYTAS